MSRDGRRQPRSLELARAQIQVVGKLSVHIGTEITAAEDAKVATPGVAFTVAHGRVVRRGAT